MDPYTPRTRTGARKKNITLSAKEYTKIAGTIASARRERVYEDVPSNGSREQRSRGEPSFISETSFVKAPLNSRVGSTSIAPKPKGKGRAQSLDQVPLDIQEALILEDLLYVLMGIEGSYVTFHPDYSPEDDDPLQGIRFAIAPSLDASLKDLVERIIPLGTYYTAISSFIEHRSHLDYGLVNHALCAAIREMLKDYQTLLSQLEHAFNSSAQFSLQKLWFYVHPTIHTLFLLYQLVLDLGSADASPDNPSDASSSSSEDEEENEALGLGGAKLKAALAESNGGENISVKGGEVLSIIYEKMQSMSGDPTASMLFTTLLRSAGKPYVNMLKVWTTTGRLVDPYEELLVKESKFIDRGILEVDYTDEYWERRYTLRDSGAQVRVREGSGRFPGGACVPPLLQGWKHKILLAGKYLNVIRECGIEVTRKTVEEQDLYMDDEKFYKFLEESYTHANRTLLELLLKDQQLVPRLRSLKRYFFLSQSFFLTHFLDNAHNELRKSAKSCSVVKLQSLLDLALNTDSQGEDTMFREDVKVVMAGSKLYDWLLEVVRTKGFFTSGNSKGEENGFDNINPTPPPTKSDKDKEKDKTMQGLDVLALDYTVKFPLSLVISRKTILRYQLLFRFLLHLKHVESALSAMWTEQKTHSWRKSIPHLPDATRWRLRVCLLRARMLSFVQQILAFATFEVLEPNWRSLEGKLGGVSTVDQLLRDHVDFLDTCLKECMLTSEKLLKAYSKMMQTCSMFSLYSGQFTKSCMGAVEGTESDASYAKRWDTLKKFEMNFNHWFKIYLDCVQYYASSENVSLLPLVVRLNSVKAAA